MSAIRLSFSQLQQDLTATTNLVQHKVKTEKNITGGLALAGLAVAVYGAVFFYPPLSGLWIYTWITGTTAVVTFGGGSIAGAVVCGAACKKLCWDPSPSKEAADQRKS